MSEILNLSKKEAAHLQDLSHVVLSANDPESALLELNQTLSKQYERPFFALTRILNNDFKSVKSVGIWRILARFPVFGKQPGAQYLMQYPTLAHAKDQLRPLTINTARMAYLFMLAIVLLFVTAFYKVRILPVYTETFDQFGMDLPTVTQFVLGSGFWVATGVACAILFIFGIFLPIALRRAMLSMQKLPKYLCFHPTYWGCAAWHRYYLWLSYARIFAQAGDDEPLVLAQKMLGISARHTSQDDWALLMVAHRQGCLDDILQRRQAQVLQRLKTRVSLTNSFVVFLLFAMIAALIGALLMGFYSPMFMLGSVS